MTRNEAILFILFISFGFYFKNAVDRKNNQLNVVMNEVEKLQEQVLKNDLRLMASEEKVSVLEQSVDSKSKKWAKVKQIRNVILEEMKESGISSKVEINEVTEIASSVVDFSEEYGVKMSLILAIIRRESHFDPTVVSPTNAQGLMQIVPSTAKEIADSLGKKYYNVFKIRDNVQFGTWYLWKMLSRFKNNEELAIRAYNCGPVYVEKIISEDIKEYPSETQKYIIDVIDSIKKYQSKGL